MHIKLARVTLEGCVTLGKMAENSLEVLTDATLHIAIQETDLLQLYSIYCYVVIW